MTRKRNNGLTAHIYGLLAIPACAGFIAWNSRTGVAGEEIADFLSHEGNVIFLVSGYLILLLASIRSGGLSELKSAIATFVGATAMVHLFRLITWSLLLRPSGKSAGFPSGHSTAAFALAFLLSNRIPRLAPLWYLIAAAIAWSRVELERHYTYQVYAGMALGILVAAFFVWRFRPRADWEPSKEFGLELPEAEQETEAPALRR